MIGPSEPTLWLAIALSCAAGLVVGRATGTRIVRLHDEWRRWMWGALVLPASVVVSLPVTGLILDVLFGLRRGGAVACTTLVKPFLLLPSVVAIGAGAWAWRRSPQLEPGPVE